jgi:hypothetical protein
MNYNLVRLGQINESLDELIYIDLKFNTGILSQIIDLFFEIKSHIDFMITEFYFTSIIEFETKKNKILHKLIFIKNKFITFHLDNHIIEKINYVKNMLKQVFYPAYLNLSNVNKYSQEIKEIKEIKYSKIKFYHKPETILIKDNFYDEEVNLEDKNKINLITNVSNNNKSIINKIANKKNKSHNKKNYVIDKIKGNKFLSNIYFSKSYIDI